MDNLQIDLQLTGKENFRRALEIACSQHRTTVGWSFHEPKDEKGRCLVLHWTDNDKTVNRFPYEMSTEQVIEFAWGWLEKEPVATKEPDHDGDNSKGFRVFTESWGRVAGDYTAFVAIKPIWAMYGK